MRPNSCAPSARAATSVPRSPATRTVPSDRSSHPALRRSWPSAGSRPGRSRTASRSEPGPDAGSVGEIGLAGQARELAEQETGPAVDVVLAHGLAHPRHTAPTLAGRHLDGAADRLGHLVDVVRIDQDGIAQLPGGAGEPAQDQHAVAVVPE